jgi:hypothetical protein
VTVTPNSAFQLAAGPRANLQLGDDALGNHPIHHTVDAAANWSHTFVNIELK